MPNTIEDAYRVLRRAEDPDVRSLAAYRSAGGYTALEKAIRQQTPEQIIRQVNRREIAWAWWGRSSGR